MISIPRFTRVELRMLDVLADGERHANTELRECLNDTLGHWHNIAFHIKNIRRKLHPMGQYVVCEVHRGKYHYRHVVLLNKSQRTPGRVI